MGHFGEIRLADPVFSAVVLPSINHHTQYIFFFLHLSICTVLRVRVRLRAYKIVILKVF